MSNSLTRTTQDENRKRENALAVQQFLNLSPDEIKEKSSWQVKSFTVQAVAHITDLIIDSERALTESKELIEKSKNKNWLQKRFGSITGSNNRDRDRLIAMQNDAQQKTMAIMNTMMGLHQCNALIAKYMAEELSSTIEKGLKDANGNLIKFDGDQKQNMIILQGMFASLASGTVNVKAQLKEVELSFEQTQLETTQAFEKLNAILAEHDKTIKQHTHQIGDIHSNLDEHGEAIEQAGRQIGDIHSHLSEHGEAIEQIEEKIESHKEEISKDVHHVGENLSKHQQAYVSDDELKTNQIEHTLAEVKRLYQNIKENAYNINYNQQTIKKIKLQLNIFSVITVLNTIALITIIK